MNKSRFFYLLVALALVVTAALTARQAVLTAEAVIAGSPAASQGSDVDCPVPDAERASIRAVHLPEANGSWPRSDAGFVGYDGGLLAVLDC
jgi:hypothetical protein